MPRKKRGRRKETDDDVSTFPSKRRHTENQGETVVISDSDDEEDYKPTPREERMRGRENRAQNRELTEEEMLDLAMRLSEQEAGTAALRQQQEEEAMRKAIAESLHANGTQANNGNSKSLSLLTSPTSASQPSQGHSPPPASESPVFPLRQSSRLSHSRAKRDGPAEDQFTTATVMDMDKNRKAGSSLCPISLSQPLSPESPLVPQFSSEKENRSLTKDPGADLAESEPQRCSSESRSQAEHSPVFPKSPAHRPVICIEKLSQDLLVDCHTTGFVLCSQKDPAIVTASGGSQSSPPLSPAPLESPTFPGTNPRDNEKLAKGRGAQSSQEPITTTGSAGSGDKEHSAASPHKQGRYPRSKDSSESASVLKTLSASVEEEQSEEQPCCRSMDQKSKQKTSEDVLHIAVGAAQPNQVFATQMTLHWSDDDDDGDDDEEGNVKQKKQEPVNTDQTRSPPKSQNAVCEESSASGSESLLRLRTSPVFPQEATCSKPVPAGASPKLTPPTNRLNPLAPAREGGSGARDVRRKLTFRDTYAAESAAPSNPGKPFHSTGGRTQGGPSLQGRARSGQPAPPKEKPGDGVVLYYWGVPFCPRGQNPDDYTQVILSQLEVYEKSLKEARRGLLRKAEWGEPDDEEEEETQVLDEAEEAEEAEEVEEVGGDERADSQKALKAGGGTGDEVEDSDTPVILSPRPVQQRSPLLFRKDETPEKLTFLRRRGLRERCPVESHTQPLEEEEEEEGMCPETQMSEDNTCDLHMESPTGSQHRQESEEMETEEVGDRNGVAPEEEEEEVRMEVEEEAAAEAPEPAAQAGSGTVECPICMCSFPLPQIEMHAAYCDGAAEESVPAETHSPVTGRRKSRRRTEVIEEDQPSSSGSGKPVQGEKCFLCQGVFPVEEYDRHVEACISHRSTRTNEAAKNLLTALDQSEQKDSAGPSHSTFKNTEHSGPIFLLDTDGSVGSEAEASPGFAISTSPIRSFTSISEATDCLVDFKRQYSSKPSQRAGRKRKFKR
ncbi:hypothetical protein MATL_G00052920 [Megalops atlanticus]|uniref:BRCA1-A complex subunit RAP80 n=1 Tax=Megalops atlanticus TaxID=7932 RepID=A0A9D3QGD7_MEGAT|nr:hypothetical protein MATL_G00052920 [Megalops atlanticus]